MNIAQLILTARQNRRLSQRQLARAAGVPQSTVGRLETGMLHPRSDTVERLLDALDCELTLTRRLGRGVDRTVVRNMLAMSPRERLLYVVSAGKAIDRLRRGAQTSR